MMVNFYGIGLCVAAMFWSPTDMASMEMVCTWRPALIQAVTRKLVPRAVVDAVVDDRGQKLHDALSQ